MQFFLCLGDVDVSVFQAIHLEVAENHRKLSLQVLQQHWDLILSSEGYLVYVLLVGRVGALLDTQDATQLEDQVVKVNLDGHKGSQVALRLNRQVIANTELLLDVEGGIEGEEPSMGHDANPVGKFIGLLQMLGAHNNGAAKLDLLN